MRIPFFFPLLALLVVTVPARAQDVLDRAEPSAANRRQPEPPAPETDLTLPEVGTAPAGVRAAPGVFVGAAVLKGLHVLTPADFADIVASRLGKTLSPGDLASFATAVANRVRARGFVFATASIAPQQIRNG